MPDRFKRCLGLREFVIRGVGLILVGGICLLIGVAISVPAIRLYFVPGGGVPEKAKAGRVGIHFPPHFFPKNHSLIGK